MGGAREPSPLMETKCSSNRSPVPASPWRELMPSARPPAPRSSMNHMLEGLLVHEPIRSRGGATHDGSHLRRLFVLSLQAQVQGLRE